LVKGPQRVVSFEFVHDTNASVTLVSPLGTFLHAVDDIIRWLQLPHIAAAIASIAAFIRGLFTN
jgi:hypothetical protein